MAFSGCNSALILAAGCSLDKINTNQHLFHFSPELLGDTSPNPPTHTPKHTLCQSRYAFHLSCSSPIHHLPTQRSAPHGRECPLPSDRIRVMINFLFLFASDISCSWAFSCHLPNVYRSLPLPFC